MLILFAILFVVFAAFGLRFWRNLAPFILAFVTLLSACSVVGGSSTLPPIHLPQAQVREVCWEPPNPEGDDDTMDTTDTVGGCLDDTWYGIPTYPPEAQPIRNDLLL